MAKKIFIRLNMFSVDQDVVVLGDDTTQTYRTTLSNLINTITDIIDAEQIEEIDFTSNKDFAQPIAEILNDKMVTKYNERNVRITINGEIFD